MALPSAKLSHLSYSTVAVHPQAMSAAPCPEPTVGIPLLYPNVLGMPAPLMEPSSSGSGGVSQLDSVVVSSCLSSIVPLTLHSSAGTAGAVTRVQLSSVDPSKHLSSVAGKTGRSTGAETTCTTLQDLIYPSHMGSSPRPLPLVAPVSNALSPAIGQPGPQPKRKLVRPRKAHLTTSEPEEPTSSADEVPAVDPSSEHVLSRVSQGDQCNPRSEAPAAVVALSRHAIGHHKQLLARGNLEKTCELSITPLSRDPAFLPGDQDGGCLLRPLFNSSLAPVSLPVNLNAVPLRLAAGGIVLDASRAGTAAPMDKPVEALVTTALHNTGQQPSQEDSSSEPNAGGQGRGQSGCAGTSDVGSALDVLASEKAGLVAVEEGGGHELLRAHGTGEAPSSRRDQWLAEQSDPLSEAGLTGALELEQVRVSESTGGEVAAVSVPGVRSSREGSEPDLFADKEGGALLGTSDRSQPVATVRSPAGEIAVMTRRRGRPRGTRQIVNGEARAKFARKRHKSKDDGLENGDEPQLQPPLLPCVHTESASGCIQKTVIPEASAGAHSEMLIGLPVVALGEACDEDTAATASLDPIQLEGSPEVPLQNELRSGHQPAVDITSRHSKRRNVDTGADGPVPMPTSSAVQLPAAPEPVRKKKKSLYVHPSKSLLSVVHDDNELTRHRTISVSTKGIIPPRLKTKL